MSTRSDKNSMGEAPPEQTKTPEEWARAKNLGFRPALILAGAAGQSPRMEQRCAVLDGLMLHARWTADQQLTEVAFDKALEAFMEEPIR